MGVSFIPHEGRTATGELIRHAQDIILLDGMQVGYASLEKPGRYVVIVQDLTHRERKTIDAAIQEVYGEPDVRQAAMLEIAEEAETNERDDERRIIIP